MDSAQISDRELLELAAKAAGLWDAKENCIDIPWSPLADDGDAFRLAVKLRLNVRMDDSGTCVWAPKGARSYFDYYTEHADAEAATRRAIVRCAAELGAKP